MRILFLLSFFLFSPLLIAQAQPVPTATPERVFRVVRSSGGAIASTSFSFLKSSNQAVYDIRPVRVAKKSIGVASRAYIFSPWGVALSAALLAAGYFLDENSNLVYRETLLPSHLENIEGSCRSSSSFSVQPLPDVYTFGGCYSYAVNKYKSRLDSGSVSERTPGIFTQISQDADSDSSFSYYYWYYCMVNRPGCYATALALFSPTSPVQEPVPGDIVPSILTDEQLADAVADTPYFEDVFTDPVTGRPNQNITEFERVATDVAEDIIARDDADPSTEPDVDLASGDTGTDNVTEEQPDLEERDLCKLHPDILACQQLEDEIQKIDLGRKEQSFSVNPVNFNSSASCPADISLSHGAAFSFKPVCDFATAFNPVIKLMSFLISIYIIVGARRAGGST